MRVSSADGKRAASRVPWGRRSRSTEITQAFSDTNRVRILILLRDGEKCVGDLVAALGVRQSTVSRHLATLRRAGLVRMRGEGLHNFYRLARGDHPLQACLLQCLGRCLAGLAPDGVDATCRGPR